MPHLSALSPHSSQSAVQDLLLRHSVPDEHAHAATSHHQALQIAHNLRYQHGWKDLRLHYKSGERSLPGPLISGLPPQRLYIHPDEQIELLKKQKDAGKTGLPELQTEREWVMPSQLQEKWSLRRFGEVFDLLDVIPAFGDGVPLFDETAPTHETGSVEEATNEFYSGSEQPQTEPTSQEPTPNPWRLKQPKRMLLATVDDDSTVVYYVVHDGIVKPRQN